MWLLSRRAQPRSTCRSIWLSQTFVSCPLRYITFCRRAIRLTAQCPSAALTSEEVAAIDEAGAKGPPSGIMANLRRNKYIYMAALLFDILVVLYVQFWSGRS